ncbi:MAG: tagaturonate reductase, partial [Oscillospiraceae bacterium]|nr:tagaturonate reductase [Oscillospiraceae bacterium]
MRQIGAGDRAAKKDVVVAQFGEGNFLRAFADQMIDVANEKGLFDGGVAIIKPINFGNLDAFKRQDLMYTVILRGMQGGEKVVEKRAVNAISQVIDPFEDYDSYLELARAETLKIVVSNTTEAGIIYDENDKFESRPANSFPGKLAQFLFARYEHFCGEAERGLIMLPCELIEQSGTKLHECVMKVIALWKLPEDFAKWINESCIFCNCLVDRIVSGYPAKEAEALERELLGYHDELMVVGEPFGLWVIASGKHEEVAAAFPLDRAGLPVVFTDDERPYRERKVRLLNGAHTSTVLAAYLMGLETVDEAMAQPAVRAFIEKTLYREIAPTVALPRDEVRAFADSVIERFENPFLAHQLLSIALNSVSKWKSRLLPTFKDSLFETGVLPDCITFSLAALAAFYRSGERGDGCLIGR